MASSDIGIRVVVLGVSEARRSIGMVRSDLNGLTSSIQEASGVSSAFATRLSALGSGLSRFGRGLTLTVTTPIVALGGSLLAAGINFEDAFAGVTKTVEGVAFGFDDVAKAMYGTSKGLSEAQIQAVYANEKFGSLTVTGQKIRDEFRKLALTIPTSAVELARIGEEAGALGVPASQITRFVEIVAKLGVATNISADEAGNAIARFANIMGVQGKDLADFAQRAGSTIVDLGNKSAATESDIVAMTYRISGAGKAVGLTSQEIIGLSTSIAELGIQSEQGGSAVSRILLEMSMAIAEGGDKLDVFAKAAGVTVDQFKSLVKNSPLEAFKKVAGGLALMQENGTLTSDTMTALDLNTIRLRDVINRFGPDMGNLTTNVKEANKAWKEGIALDEEAEKRYKTVKSQLILLRNTFSELGIVIFDLYKNDIAKLIQKFKEFVLYLSKLPSGLTKTIVKVALLAAALGPLLVMFGTLLQLVAVAITGFSSLSSILSFGKIATVLFGGGASSLLGIFGALVPVLGIVGAAFLAWKTNFLGIKTFIKSFVDSFLRLSGIKTGVINTYRELSKSIKEIVRSFMRLSGIKQNFKGIAISLGKGDIGGIFKSINEGVNGIVFWFNNIGSPLIAKAFNNIGQIVSMAWSQMMFWLQNFGLPMFSKWIQSIISTLIQWQIDFVTYIVPLVAPVLNALISFFGIILDWIIQQIPPLVEQLTAWGKAFIQWVVDVTPSVVDALSNFITSVWNWIKDQVPKLGDKLAEWGTAFVKWLADAIPDLLKKLNDWFNTIVFWFANNFPKIYGALAELAKNFVSWVSDATRDIAPKLGYFLGRLVAWIFTDVIPTNLQNIPVIVAEFLTFVDKLVTDFGPKALDFTLRLLKYLYYDLPLAVGDAVKGFGKGLVDGISSGWDEKWQSFKDKFINAFRALGPLVKQLINDLVPDNINFGVFGSVSIPNPFPDVGVGAKGGNITGPTLVGEKGKELFLPNTNGFLLSNTMLKNIANILSSRVVASQTSNTVNRSVTYAPVINGVPMTNERSAADEMYRVYRMMQVTA